MTTKAEQEEKRQLLIELGALATKLNFPTDKRTNYRWIAQRAMISNVYSSDYQRLIKIVRRLALLNNDCFMGIPTINV